MKSSCNLLPVNTLVNEMLWNVRGSQVFVVTSASSMIGNTSEANNRMCCSSHSCIISAIQTSTNFSIIASNLQDILLLSTSPGIPHPSQGSLGGASLDLSPIERKTIVLVLVLVLRVRPFCEPLRTSQTTSTSNSSLTVRQVSTVFIQPIPLQSEEEILSSSHNTGTQLGDAQTCATAFSRAFSNVFAAHKSAEQPSNVKTSQPLVLLLGFHSLDGIAASSSFLANIQFCPMTSLENLTRYAAHQQIVFCLEAIASNYVGLDRRQAVSAPASIELYLEQLITEVVDVHMRRPARR
eukprot:748523-Hanusia_phi.AAC.4